MLVVPGRRPTAQPGLRSRVGSPELGQEKLGEQVVEPIDVTVVQREDEQVARRGERPEQLSTVVALHHRVAERSRQAIEDRGLEQEGPPLRGQAVQHLVVQVRRYAMVRGQQPPQDERWVGVLGERENAQVEPRWPAVGAPDQLLHHVRRQLVELASDLGRLRRRVGKVRPVELEQATGQSTPRQVQRRQRPTGQCKCRTLGDQVDQVVHRRHCVPVVDHVGIVEHHEEGLIARLERSRERRQDLAGHVRLAALEQVLGASHVHPTGSQTLHQVAEEHDGVVVGHIEAQPPRRPRVGVHPLRHQSRLAEPCAGADGDEGGILGQQPVEQCAALQQVRTRAGRAQALGDDTPRVGHAPLRHAAHHVLLRAFRGRQECRWQGRRARRSDRRRPARVHRTTTAAG